MILLAIAAAAPARAQALEVIPQVGHSQMITRTVFSADGRIALTASKDSTARVWDLDAHLMLRVLRGHSSIVTTAAISADGKLGVTAGYDNSVRVWRLDDGRELYRLDGHEHIVWAVDITPDGKRAVSAGHDQQVIAWDLATGKALHAMAAHTIQRGAKISPDGHWALSWGNGTVNLVDVDGGVLRRLPDVRENRDAAFSADGRHVVSCYDDVRVWDMATATVVRTFPGTPDKLCEQVGFAGDHVFAIADGVRSEWRPDGSLVASAPYQRPPDRMTFDVENGRELHGALMLGADRLVAYTDGGTLSVWTWRSLSLASAVTRDDNNLASSRASLGATETLALIDADHGGGGARLFRLPDQRPLGVLGNDVASVALTPDGKRAVLGGTYQGGGPIAVELWDVGQRAKLATLGGGPASADRVAVSADASAVIALPASGWPVVFDTVANTHYELQILAQAAAFSPDGARLAIAERELAIVDPKTGKELARWVPHPVGTTGIAWSADGARIATSGRAATGGFEGVKVWSATGQLLRTYDAPYTNGVSVAMSPDGKYLASGRSDGTIALWRADTGDRVTLVSRGREWLVVSPDGYFDASANGGSLVAVARGLRAYRADQLAATRNRPDLLLARMGLGTPGQISHYQKRHEARLARLGLAASALGDVTQAPTATIASVEPAGDHVRLRAELVDPDGALDAYNIYINDVPLYAAPGRKVSGGRAAVDATVELGAGKNQIEISVIDASGIESLRDVRLVDGPAARPRDLYYVGFGVSHYRDRSLNLGYAHKDALDLGAVLKATEGRGFRRVHAAVYVDDEVTPARFREVRGLLARAGVDDTVVVFVAGHGTYTEDARADYVFLAHDTDVRRLHETAIGFSAIEELLAATPSRRKLLLMDTCESGEREPAELDVAAPATGTRARTTRSLRRVTVTRRPRAYLLDRDRLIYQDVFRRTGSIVFSSSHGSELSWELDSEQNGAFTAAIKRALTTPAADADHDGIVSTDELRAYVPGVVAGLTADRQHPTVDRDNRSVQLAFAIASGPVAPLPHAAPAPRGCACNGSGADAGFLLVLLALVGRRSRRKRRIT